MRTLYFVLLLSVPFLSVAGLTPTPSLATLGSERVTPSPNTCPLPTEYLVVSCLNEATALDEGYLLGDDGVTQVPVLRLKDAQGACTTNTLSHPFVFDLQQQGAISNGLWFSPESVDAIFNGDRWEQRPKHDQIAIGDIVVHRDEGKIDSVALVRAVNADNEGMTAELEFKPDGRDSMREAVRLPLPHDRKLEVWFKPSK